MDELLRSVGAVFMISLAVTCLGGLYDVRKRGESVTWEGVMKAVAIAGLIPAAWLAFGVASWAVSTFLFGWIAKPVMIAFPLTLLAVGIIRNIVARRRTRRT
jgi:hypothetical protein